MYILSTGTLTFLFTSVEGSNRLWEDQPQTVPELLRDHAALLKDTIERYNGYIFKEFSDALCVAFGQAPQALACAIEAQRHLHTHPQPLKIQMALHTGLAELRDGDYFGPTLNRVARILALGHGGQILLSAMTAQTLEDVLPGEVELRDLGERSLKDIARPERIFQVVAADLPSEFPPLKTNEQHPNNLPSILTSFVGREVEIVSVATLLRASDRRLVTLTGPGGTGKTRLSLQVAANLLDDFPDGVFFVPLAPITDHAQVALAIAQSLELKDSGAGSLVELLKNHLKTRRMLLVVDNFEQVTDAADLLAELLDAAPNLKMLVSSRVKLQLEAEHEYGVPPLALPDLEALPPVTILEKFAAIKLFVQRAQASRPDFAVTPDNAAALAEICTRLDGLPLAIELAAARVKYLSLQAMLPQLNNRLKLLAAGPRDLPARQQTLRGAIAWSYDLLDDAEKTFFARLAVLVDGFTAPAAREVGALSNADDLLASLTDKNLVRKLPSGRYRLLETIREFAHERLNATTDLEATRERHARYFFKDGLEATAYLNKAEQGVWLDVLSTEHNNYRTALDWFYTRQEGGAGIRLAVALWMFWSIRGFLSEGRDRLQKMLNLSENITDVKVVEARAEALSGLATLAWRQSDYAQAIALSEKGLALSRAHGLTIRAAHALWVLGSIAWTQSDYDRAKVYLEESIILYREGGDIEGLTFSLNSLGLIAQNRGEFSRARELYTETTALCRTHSLTASLAFTLNVLGMVRQYQGAYAEAEELARESLEIFQRHADKGGIASALATLGLIAIRLEQYPTAETYLQEALQLRRDLGHKWGVVLLLNNLALAARLQKEYRQTEQFCSESLALARSINDRRGIATALLHLGYFALYRADLPTAEGWLDESLRLYCEIGDNPGVAEVCEALARVRVGQSRAQEATELAQTAAATRAAMGAPLPPAECRAYDSLILKIGALSDPEEATVYLNVQTDPNQ